MVIFNPVRYSQMPGPKQMEGHRWRKQRRDKLGRILVCLDEIAEYAQIAGIPVRHQYTPATLTALCVDIRRRCEDAWQWRLFDEQWVRDALMMKRHGLITDYNRLKGYPAGHYQPPIGTTGRAQWYYPYFPPDWGWLNLATRDGTDITYTHYGA